MLMCRGRKCTATSYEWLSKHRIFPFHESSEVAYESEYLFCLETAVIKNFTHVFSALHVFSLFS